MTIILIIIIAALYLIGGMVTMLLTGWELTYLPDLIKITFWPISIFIAK